MDCNKDEAVKAQQVAENKILSGDYSGAKKFILKAQRLFPELNGLPQLLAVVDVHSSFQDVGSKLLQGNWHKILQVDFSAEEETVKKQYKKLILLLHPDKNKSAGATSAFELVKEAWGLFLEGQKGASKLKKQGVTFWTNCSYCEAQSQWPKEVEEQFVQCFQCLKSFQAMDTLNHFKEHQKRETVNVEISDDDSQKFRWNSQEENNAGADAEWVESSTDTTKKKRKLKSRADQKQPHKHKRRVPRQSASDPSCSNEISEGGIGVSVDEHSKENGCASNVGNNDMRQIHATQRLKVQLLKKLRRLISNGIKDEKLKHIEIREEENATEDKHGELKFCVTFTLQHATTEPAGNGMGIAPERNIEMDEGIDHEVPDSDIYNFDHDRQEGSFKIGQIWALYDDDDGMPRYYAQITKVMSLDPFHVSMKWLYPADSVAKDAGAWCKSGFQYTCGEYKLGKKPLRKKTVCVFSHVMAHWQGEQGTIRIYPQKGEVWALYKKWKPVKGVMQDFEPVEVVSHYTEEGITVAPLFRVAGFKTVFSRMAVDAVQSIPTKELLRFSHQIPAHRVGGDVAVELPENSMDLDTAAMVFE